MGRLVTGVSLVELLRLSCLGRVLCDHGLESVWLRGMSDARSRFIRGNAQCVMKFRAGSELGQYI